MAPTSRLRPWLILAAVAVIAVVALGLLLRRRPAPPPIEAEAESEEPLSQPVARRSPSVRQKVAELSAKLDRARAEEERARKEKERACLTSNAEDCPFLDPTPAALAEMARCGILKVDMPDLDVPELPANEGKDPEAEPINQAVREVSGRVRDDLRSLHADLGLAGDPPATVREFLEMIETNLPRADAPDIQRRLAQERAGLASPPGPEAQSASERYWRLRAGIGDDFEATLARKLGPARARALRKRNDGWTVRGVYTGQCRGDGGL